nr:type II toxin-antitoxin system RelE/ParE family toxin [Ramlibacter sp. Leaf400]
MATSKRVFKLKTFSRWAKGVLTDEQLCEAGRDVIAGRYEADLGGGLCKKRIATEGRGKSGATRTLLARKHEDAVFFLAGREKSDPGTDFSDQQVEAVKLIAKGLQKASDGKLTELLAAGTIQEICDEEPTSRERSCSRRNAGDGHRAEPAWPAVPGGHGAGSRALRSAARVQPAESGRHPDHEGPDESVRLR